MSAVGRGLAVAAGMVLLSACATQTFGVPPAPSVAGAEQGGYLSHEALVRLAGAVPPPSADGSPEQAADRALSDRYRALENSDRWLLATAHAELSPQLALQHFDCAMGVRFTGTPTPHLVAVLEKVLNDANEAAELAKARAFRPRPVGVDSTRVACQRVSDAGRASPSYPSGSASVGAAYGDALAAIAPDKAAAVREIGHQIAVSRAVCGMHYPADVTAGEAVGHAVFGEIAATPAFQADLIAARDEVTAVRASGLTNPGCAAERAALARPLP